MKNFKIITVLLLIAEGIGGAYVLLLGLEWIEIIPVGLEKVDKIFFILVGAGIVLLVVSVGFLLCRSEQNSMDIAKT